MGRCVVLLVSVLTFVLAAATTAWGHDLLPPSWRGQDGTTFQVWEFDNDEDPSSPSTVENPYGAAVADINVGRLGSGWLERLDGMGTQTGFWDIGLDGGSIVIDIDNRPAEMPWKEIWIQVTYFSDITLAPLVSVPDGKLIGDVRTEVVEQVDARSAWLMDLWVFRIEPNPNHEQIIISSDPEWGAVIDEIVVDTWCVPEPATLVLVLLGGLLVAGKRFKR